MESPLAIANYFVDKAHSEGVSITPMKLVKLVFLSYGWYLAINDEELFSEDIQAWKLGPVVESVYHKFKKYGSGEVKQKQSDIKIFEQDGEIIWGEFIPEVKSDVDFFDKIWNTYKDYSGTQLSALTHMSGSPWDITYNKLGGKEKLRTRISPELIKLHYKKLSSKS